MYERLSNEGRILKKDAWELCTLFDVNFTPTNMTVAQLESGFMELGAKLYSEDFTRERREKFFRRLHEKPRRKQHQHGS